MCVVIAYWTCLFSSPGFCSSFSKIVSGSRTIPPRWPPQCSCIVIESSFDPGERLQAPWSLWGSYVKLSTAVQPSWSEGGTTRHFFGRGPSNDYVIKVWFQLSNWFKARRFLCDCVRQSHSPTKMAATVQLHCYWKQLWSRWAITGSWEPLVVWPLWCLSFFDQSLVPIEQLVPDKKIFMWISHRFLC
jgi:hypothetical protein